MIQAQVVQMADGDLRVRIFQTLKGKEVWARIVHQDDAAFLIMDIEEVLKEIRLRTPRVVD